MSETPYGEPTPGQPQDPGQQPPQYPSYPQPGQTDGQQQPYGQQPYGQPQGQPPGQPQYQQPGYQNPYGQPAYAPYGVAQAPEHPQATTVLILGILGLVLCQVLAPFAWVMGNRVVREIDASGGHVGGRSSANAGRICGIVGTVLIVLSILAVIAFVVFALAVGVSASSSYSTNT